jgi:tetratricopeptide (TPR) repeat protein
MGRWWKPLLIAGLISLSYLVPASAGVLEDRRICDGGGPAEPQVHACSRLIAGGRFKGRDLGVTYNNRAFAHLMQKDFSRAVADYDMAISLAPSLEDAWFGRGRAFAARGDLQRGIADFDRAIALKPSLARHYVLRGEAFAALGDNARALADFEQAIRLEPGNNPFAYHARGAILRRNGNFDGAIASHDQGLRINPADAFGFASRAYASSEKGEHDRALADADEALRIAPGSAYGFLVRGLIFSRKGNFARAVADLDETIRLSPKDARAYLWRGLAHEQSGDTFRASADFQAALAVTEGRKDDREQAQSVARQHLHALQAARQQPVTVAAAAAVAPSVPASIAAPQPQGRRVALVIGNSEYRAVPMLPNPKRDAATIADALRRTGFQSVTLANDLTREQMHDALRRFAVESDNAEWSLVYFAGHGIEVGGQNYVIPVDAKLSADRDVQFEAVQLEQVLAATDGARKLRLLLLDACRENPYANQMKRVVASRTIDRGLAQVETDAGMLVVFAARHGQVAFDGQGGNSPFVSALVQRMLTPQLEIRKMFDLVRDDVMAATGRRQQPFSYGSVPGSEDFYFMRTAEARTP